MTTIEQSTEALSSALAAKVEAARDLEARTAELETCDPADAPKASTAVVKAAAVLRAADRAVAQCTIALEEAERADKSANLEAARVAADTAVARSHIAEIAAEVIALEAKIAELRASAARVLSDQNAAHLTSRDLAKYLGAEYDGHPVPKGQVQIARAYIAATQDPAADWTVVARHLARALEVSENVPATWNWPAKDRADMIVMQGPEAYTARYDDLEAKQKAEQATRRADYLAREDAWNTAKDAFRRDPHNPERRAAYHAACEAFGVSTGGAL